MATPGHARVRLSTTDVDEARVEVARLFCAHGLEPVREARTGPPLDVTLRSTSIGSVGLTYLDYGGPVRIDPEPLRDFFLVQVPLAGRATITSDGETITSDPTLASVLHPTRRLSMRWGAGNPHLILYVRRAALEAQLGRLLGQAGPRPADLSVGMPMADPRVVAWWRAVELLRAEIDSASPVLDEPVAARQLEQMIMTRLLLAHPRTLADPAARGRTAPSRVVARARRVIAERAAEEIGAADVAAAVGVSLRSLQEGFRRELGTTPTAYLRDLRLARAHEQLQAADPASTSVTKIAAGCGFVHLGRFAVDYRRRYGRTPSQTLAED